MKNVSYYANSKKEYTKAIILQQQRIHLVDLTYLVPSKNINVVVVVILLLVFYCILLVWKAIPKTR